MRITHGLFSGGESVFSELPAHRKIELMEVPDDCFVRSLKLRFFYHPCFFFIGKITTMEKRVDFSHEFFWGDLPGRSPFFCSAACLRDGK